MAETLNHIKKVSTYLMVVHECHFPTTAYSFSLLPRRALEVELAAPLHVRIYYIYSSVVCKFGKWVVECSPSIPLTNT